MSSYQNFVKLIIKCLNPYYNGKYSMSLYSGAQMIEILSLNPYYNGKYSMRSIKIN